MHDEVLIIRGRPRPQPRPRFVRGRVVSTLNDHAKHWRAAVRSVVETHFTAPPEWPSGCEIALEFVFGTKDKTRFGRPHRLVPDTDNLAKLILDVLQDGGALPGGDQDVTRLTVRKVWGSAAEEGCIIRMRHGPEMPGVPAELAA